MEMVEEGIHQPKITTKRIKVEEIAEKEEEDRISALPDCVLLEILSRLPSTKNAIRTGTLSKRWKYLWTSVPTLIFKRYVNDAISKRWVCHRPSDFVSLVDKTLNQCRQSKLRKFAVDTRYDITIESQVNNWIRFAISCNVEELDLSLYTPYMVPKFLLNEFFFINSCFTDLKLQGCIFNPTAAISWKRLKSLRISCGNLGEDLIENILSGSPLLETLVLTEEYGCWQLGITSKSIKKLVFSECYDHPVESESQVNNRIRYAISRNIEELDLRFWNSEHDDDSLMLNEEFFICSCVTDMKLSYCIFNPKGAIGWKKLRSLCISNGNLDEDVIENILSGSPLLETLVLVDCYGYRRLDITSKSVKRLEFYRYYDGDGDDEFEIADDIIEINAPNILSLTIKGHLHLSKLLLSNVSSLVEANLDFTLDGLCDRDEISPAEKEMLKGFIRSLLHVKELKIGDYYCKDAYKKAMLEKHESYRDLQFVLRGSSGSCNTCRSYVGSISQEVQQLKEKIQKMEHEQAEREAEWVKREGEWVKREAEQVMREVEREARDAQQEAKMKEMQDKLKAFEELLSRFPRPPLS